MHPDQTTLGLKLWDGQCLSFACGPFALRLKRGDLLDGILSFHSDQAPARGDVAPGESGKVSERRKSARNHDIAIERFGVFDATMARVQVAQAKNPRHLANKSDFFFYGIDAEEVCLRQRDGQYDAGQATPGSHIEDPQARERIGERRMTTFARALTTVTGVQHPIVVAHGGPDVIDLTAGRANGGPTTQQQVRAAGAGSPR